MSALRKDDWSTSSDLPVQLHRDRDHYVFCPVDHSAGQIPGGGIDCSASSQYNGFPILLRSVFHRVRNKTYWDLRGVTADDSDIVQTGADNPRNEKGQIRIHMTVGKVEHTNYAQDIAFRLEHVYKDMGVCVLPSLTAIPQPVVDWFQDLLIPADIRDSIVLMRDHLARFDPSAIPDLPASDQWTAWKLTSPKTPVQIVTLLKNQLTAACAQGFSWLQMFYEEYVKEMKQATVPGKFGLDVVTDKLRLVSRELQVAIPAGLEQNVLAARAAVATVEQVQQATPTIQFPPEFIEFMRMAVQQGIVKPVEAGAIGPVAVTESIAEPKPVDPEVAERRRAGLAKARQVAAANRAAKKAEAEAGQ